MVDRLVATRFLAVLGASGSGKSSLVRTGLIEALDLGLGFSPRSRWKIADLHPGGQPIRNLAAALLDTKGSSYETMDVDFLSTFLRNGPRAVREWVSGSNLPPDSKLLILVDQFEELFRYSDYAQREEAEAFVSLLLESTATADVPIYVVLTMRSEFLGACALIPGLAERINAGLYLTPRMSREECRAAIEGPAGVVGFAIEPVLVNRLLNDLAAFAPWGSDGESDQAEHLSRRSDQLPIMQHVLNRLWVRAAEAAEGAAVVLRLAEYEQIGGLSGALDVHGAEVLASLSPSQSSRGEVVFRALVTGTSVASAVRRPARLNELIELAGGARDDVVAIVEAFRAAGCNFVRTSEASLGTDTVIVDISHESLIRQWTPLREWLQKEARDDAAWRRLTTAQERHAEGQGDLLAGLDLDSIAAWWESVHPSRTWAARHGGDFEAAAAFLHKSRQAQQGRIDAERERQVRERNRWRKQRAGLVVALIAALSLVVFAGYQRRSAQQQEAKANDASTKLKEHEKQLRVIYDYIANFPTLRGAVLNAGKQVDPPTLERLFRELADVSFTPNPAVSTDEAGIAIYGYDPVAYFTHDQPVPGDVNFYAIWNGGIWLFSSDKTRDQFKADPRRYEPAYGGFCAYCLAVGHKHHGDPTVWVIRGNRVYLHELENYRQWWSNNPEHHIKLAGEQWSMLSGWRVGSLRNIAISEQIAEKTRNAQKAAEPQYERAQRLVDEKKWEEAAGVLEDVLRKYPRYVKGLQRAEWIYQERLFRYERAFDLNARRVELGSGGEHDFIEKHLTTGRFADCSKWASFELKSKSEKRLRLVMSGIRLGCLAGAQRVEDLRAAARQLRTEVVGLKKVEWTFDGTKHFVGTDSRFAGKAKDWIDLFESLEQGDEQKALGSLSRLVPG